MEFRKWVEELFAGDNSKVNTMAFLAVILAAPIVCVALVGLAYDIFWLHRGLTDISTRLIIAMLGVATGGLGASMYSKTTLSKTVEKMESVAKPDDPDAGKEVG